MVLQRHFVKQFEEFLESNTFQKLFNHLFRLSRFWKSYEVEKV